LDVDLVVKVVVALSFFVAVLQFSLIHVLIVFHGHAYLIAQMTISGASSNA
jgi:hypothetical protein